MDSNLESKENPSLPVKSDVEECIQETVQGMINCGFLSKEEAEKRFNMVFSEYDQDPQVPGELQCFNLAVGPETVELLDKLQAHFDLPDKGAVFMHGLNLLNTLVSGNCTVSMSPETAKDLGYKV